VTCFIHLMAFQESRAPWSKHSARLKHMRCQELKQQHEVGADVSHLQF